MTRALILLTCTVAAATAALFLLGSVLSLLKLADLTTRAILEIALGFVLFLAASMTAMSIWKRRKSALWAWLPVLLVSAPTVLSWAYQSTRPANFEFASEAEAQSQTGSFLRRPTEAEFARNRRDHLLIHIGLLGILVFQTGALMYLRQTEVLK